MVQPVIRSKALLFPWPDVLRAVNETRSARSVQTLYGEETGPGLWLVGDHGVYLMSNTAAKASAIVYARECDPTKLPFDTWWEKKQATFGGDDGVEFISLTDIETLLTQFQERHGPPRLLRIEFTPENFSTDFM
jgi:hypothetical protein